ncbi:type IV secretory system conjugative DNA transfer family protein [Thermomonospora cellulosilytica]|uniref:Type IV secretory pathway TraG/TraD family ATPase VirD4 n=1 Tax=Thermomonospora cellulosilytica TaxID=1411118 RepID=A0A7W3N4D6_9ACTN|nr:TraM recognition domain-containing protein [Thermomonospora cellulosilytica]MBA9007300.1 type IV secretory pathway TraG/TraD family ATPase VirD4 [Thermomonospora cellulosilytica]
MSRALGPRPSMWHSSAAGGWLVLLLCWAPVLCFALVWVAARAAAAVAGGRVRGFGSDFILAVLHGRFEQAWPGTPTPLVVIVLVAGGLGIVVAGNHLWWRVEQRRSVPGDPVQAMAGGPGLEGLHRRQVAAKAVELRRSLRLERPERLEAGEIGLLLGHELRRSRKTGPALYASWEDTLVAFMAPRSGKTTALSIPYVLSAPGGVIATSNKADLWAATARLRAEAGGRVWLFDPQKITYQPQAWWWNPLAALGTVEDAHRLAGHFVLTVDDPNKKDLWGPAAQDLLCALFLAAATSGRTLHHVAGWLDEPAVPTPIELLRHAGFALMASSLKGTQNGATETRDGIYQTARTAAKCLRDQDILAWVTPHDDLPALDPAKFVRPGPGEPGGTLYLLSKSRSAAAPLIAALTDTVMRAAEHQAEQSGGRLDPPLVVVLDEAANICRIADLPELYSHLGSRGIVPVTILQSYEQGITVWGEPGMAALWGAATRKLIGAGTDSPRLAKDLATLIGQHDVPVRSLTYADGRASEQISLRRQDILEPAAIRALPPGTALLLATGGTPALLNLHPWYTTPHATQITQAIGAAETAITQAARRHHRHKETPINLE